MSWSSSFARTMNRLYPRLTQNAEARLVAQEPTGSVSALGRRHVTVVSYRSDGSAVATPVWFAVLDGQVVFRSLADAAKIRRIAADDRVLLAPCTPRGHPVGPPMSGRARLLEGPAAQAAEHALRRRYSLGRRVYKHLTRGAPAAYVAVTPSTRTAGGTDGGALPVVRRP